jgi:hypothetical protein
VNIAARLEAEAPVGGILISRAVHDAVAGKLKLTLIRAISFSRTLSGLCNAALARDRQFAQRAINSEWWVFLERARMAEERLTAKRASWSNTAALDPNVAFRHQGSNLH